MCEELENIKDHSLYELKVIYFISDIFPITSKLIIKSNIYT